MTHHGDTTNNNGGYLKQLLVMLAAVLISSVVTWAFTSNTNDAVQKTRLDSIQAQVDTKASREEVQQILRSLDGLASETRSLREEMAKTREELAAERGRRGR